MELSQQMPPLYQAGAPSVMDRFGSTVKDLTDPSYLIPQIENDLRRIREIRNEATKKWEVQSIGRPLLNDQGIANVMSVARVAVNNISVLNELSNDVIMNTMKSIYLQLIRDLMLSREDYDIRSSKDRHLILSLVLTPIWLTLNRSREGGERKFLQSKPGVYEVPQQEKGGFWNIFRGGR